MGSRKRIATALIAAVLAFGVSASAAAQGKTTEFQVEQFEPLPAQRANLGNLAGSQPLGHLAPSFGLTFHLVDDPVEVRTNGDTTTRLVDDQFKAEVLAGVGFFEWVDIGVALPVVLYQSADDLTDFGQPEPSAFGVADIRVVPRVRVLKPEWAGGVGAAILLPLYLPTGDTSSFNGDGNVRVEPRLAVDWSHEIGLRVLANLGYQTRTRHSALNYVSDDVVRWGLGVEAPVGLEMLRATAGIFGSTSVADGRDPEDLTVVAPNRRGHPVEAQLGLRAFLNSSFMLLAGAGFGLTPSVGSPDFRAIAGLEWTPFIDFDDDGDGISNGADACPKQAEDRDGWEDADGCPDLDNDTDRVLDAADECKDSPEDHDGFEDLDGCPDTDNDADGIADLEDRCPDEAGPAGTMGCPPEDSDGDGLFDHEEQCINEPEDMDGFQDEDGCPEIDNDFDGFLDEIDACPVEAEVYNGRSDDDGCPDTPASKIQPAANQIVLLEPIDFGTGNGARSRARAVLDQIAAAIAHNGWAAGIRIEAHTRDDEAKSLEQAEKHAEIVRAYLVKKGIGEERLAVEVVGASQPLGSDAAANERIEIHYDGVAETAVSAVEQAAEPEPDEPEAPEEPAEAAEPEAEEPSDGFDFTGGDE